jgi:ATP-binding cassette, subfamily B, bacterial
MASTPTAPDSDGEHASDQIAGGPPPGVPAGTPPGAPAGAPMGGIVSSPMAGPGRGMAGMPLPAMSARPYIARSLSMLRGFGGSLTGLIVLGLIASIMPFVASAVFGPLIQLLGQAGKGGVLHGVWGHHGALSNHPPGGTSGPFSWLAHPLPFHVLLIIWAGSLVLAQVMTFFRAWLNAQVEWKLLTSIRQRVHDHLQSLSLDFFTGEHSGALMQRVSFESMGVQRLLSDCLVPSAVDAVVLVIALIYMLALSWQMTIATLILSPLALITLQYVGKKLQATQRRMLMTNRQLGGELEETISGISDIQIFNAQQHRSERFHEASESNAKESALIKVWLNVSGEGTQIFIALSTALVLIVGVWQSANWKVDLATLVVFIGFVPTMYAPASRLISSYTTYASIAPNIVTTYQLLDTKPTVEERPDAENLGELHGNIVLEDVVFGYSPHQKILNGLSFSINQGETVALVGPIGAGKSTVFNLLLRFLDPDSGRIVLDGHDISRATFSSLRMQVSKLAQFPFFMKDTISENVRMGRPDAGDAEVEDACKLAHIHEVIINPDEIPLGYDTVVDVQVPSGGQKRLIAMARCLLRKPEVLLLDEPTENIDADERVRLTRTIRNYAADRTCIVISHDMEFISAVADRIIVLHGGRVAEEGTHEELLAAGGLYTKLYEAQRVDPSLVRGATPPSAASAAPMVGAPSMPHP